MEDNRKNKSLKIVYIAVVLLIIVALMVSMLVISSIRSYYNQMYQDGESLAGNYSAQYSLSANNYLNNKLEELDKDVETVSKIEYFNDFLAILQDIEHNGNDFQIVQYCKDNVLYDSQGLTISLIDSQVSMLMQSNENRCSGLFKLENDRYGIGFSKNFTQNKFCDKIIGFVFIENFISSIGSRFALLENMPTFYSMPVCKSDGAVLGHFRLLNKKYVFETRVGTEIDANMGENAFATINQLTINQIKKEDIVNTIKIGSYYSKYVKISTQNYIVSIVSPILSYGDLVFVQVYDTRELLVAQNEFISIIIMSIIALIVIVALLVIIGMDYRKTWKEKLENTENYELITGCNTYKMFKSQFATLYTNNKGTKFALMYLEINQYDILYENYGEQVANNIISFCGKIISKSIDNSETYGHIASGQFVVGFHYRDNIDLDNKIDIIYALIHNYNKFEKVDYTLNFTAGIYLLSKNDKHNIDTMLSNAIIAQKSLGINTSTYYCIYDKYLDDARQREREIELRKEQALTNKEFIVYFQPKLNLKSDSLDGAEALVRWYYPETDTIYSPAKFLPIFELNGFIEKLDKYIYLEVLNFIKRMVDEGKKMCPISINVSRFTALQQDFLSFYINNKRNYGIADGYIYIEFTESFAFDNNEKLREIVVKLRENGIKCSIDDFGVGYSSYSILKDLPMDEIKLDALFMKEGYDRERDEKTLRSVIALGKDLGMKVTQEGVETEVNKNKLKQYGCDILQGYLYSKPLSSEDFEKFLVRNMGVYGKKK